MDAVTDPTVRQVTVMKSARVGYTKILDHIIGYYIHQDPAPILVVQPRIDDAHDYSRTEIAPMLRDTPCLSGMVGEFKARDSDQRIAKRLFSNGSSVSFVGAASPGGFRRITARIVCFDEVDGYELGGAGVEGDQISLGVKRTESFWNRKIIIGSTPTIKVTSRIEPLYLESDQRRYFVPCPQCGHMQTLRFANLAWDKGPNGEHLTDTAHFVCEQGCIIEEHNKPEMLRRGQWVAAKPFKGHAGFHIWAAYSLFPNAAWRHIAAEFVRVKKDATLLRTFTNIVLGENWEQDAETVAIGGLIGRGENYGVRSIPVGVSFLTGGVDVQADRLELIVLGHGPKGSGEIWVIDYVILYGDTAQSAVWLDLDKVLLRQFMNEQGQELRLRAVCVDVAYQTLQGLNFCMARRGRHILPVRGVAGEGHAMWPQRATHTKTHHTIFLISADKLKETIYGRLRNAKPGNGYVHFPAGPMFGEEFFDQLTSERVVMRKSMGKTLRVWELPSGRRNEVLDTFAYALAARLSLNVPGLDGAVIATEEQALEEMSEPAATRKRLNIREMARRMNKQ